MAKIDYGPCYHGSPEAVIAGSCLVLFSFLVLGENRKILAAAKRLSLDLLGVWLTRQETWRRQLLAIVALLIGILFILLGIFGLWGHCFRGA
jgi:hypothetical protein